MRIRSGPPPSRPTARRIVTASEDHTARLWDAATGGPIGEAMRHEDRVNSAAFSPDGSRIVTASEDNTARLWDAATGAPIGQPMKHEDRSTPRPSRPTARRIVTVVRGQHGAAVGRRDRLRRSATPWSIRVEVELRDLLARRQPHRHRVAKTIRRGCGTPRPARRSSGFEALRSPVIQRAFSPDGTRIVTASDDNTARLWDAATGAPIGAPMKHEDLVNSAAFSPDGTRIVTASDDNTARLWDAATGAPIGAAHGTWEFCHCRRILARRAQIVTASLDKTARLWDAATGAPIGELMKHEDWVTSAAFSPDGRRIVTASRDNMARLWDVATGAVIGDADDA